MMTVKRTIIAAVATAALALPASVFALGGECVNCHTMHNSQDGTSVPGSGIAYGTGNNTLLKASGCIGCHAHSLTNDLVTGYATSGISAPQVTATTGTLAGGYFSNVDVNSHNVYELRAGSGSGVTQGVPTLTDAPGDAIAANFPNGAALSCDNSTDTDGDSAPNNTGCHSATQAHHNNESGTVSATDNGSSFRFLDAQAAGVYVDGTEGVNYGVDNTDPDLASIYSTDAAQGIGISLCNSCHGDFHGYAEQENVAPTGSLQTTTWGLHPTEIVVNAYLTDSGEVYNDGNGYNPAIPMGGFTTTGFDARITAGEGQVICLSCHIAHGSAYPDLLRWDYTPGTTVMQAGQSSAGGYAVIAATLDTSDGSTDAGCFICHTDK